MWWINVYNLNPLLDNLENVLRKYNTINYLHICTIPHRHNIYSKHAINNNILKTNAFIKEMAKTFSNVHMIDMYNLQNHHFTRHGLHLSRRGKIALRNFIQERVNLTSKSVL